MTNAAEKVVLAPDVLARSFFDPACWRVLTLWRDGRIRPVVTRELLGEYARLLRNLGFPLAILRQWVLWFTHAEKSVYLEPQSSPSDASPDPCARAAQLGEAVLVISAAVKPPPQNAPPSEWQTVRRVTPAQYLASLKN